MLKKLATLSCILLVAVSVGFAADVAVDSAAVHPHPVPANDTGIVVAQISNHGTEDVFNVPILGRIDHYVGENILLAEEGFEGDFLPEGWTIEQSNDSATWIQDDTGGEFDHNDLYGAYVYWDVAVSDEWLISPALDLSGYDEWDVVTLNLSAAFQPLPQEINAFYYVCISTDGGTTWSDTLADMIHDYRDDGEWITMDSDLNPFAFDLSGFAGDTITIGFNFYSTEGEGEFQTLDDVSVTAIDYSDPDWEARGTVDAVLTIAAANFGFIDNPWIPTEEGYYRLSVWTELPNDDDPSNDMFVDDDILVGEPGELADMELYEINHPFNVEAPHESFIPSAVVVNNSENTVHGVPIVCRISKEGADIYDETILVSLDPDTSLVDAFPAFMTDAMGTDYTCMFMIEYYTDPDSSNNWKQKDFISGYPHCIVPVEILEPEADAHYESEVTPAAIYENFGLACEDDWLAICKIERQSDGYYCVDTVYVQEPCAPDSRKTVTFKTFNLPETKATYICKFSAYVNVEGFGTENIQTGFSGGDKTGIEEEVMPKEYALAISNSILMDNVNVKYALPQSGHVSIKLYDVSGKLVKTIVDNDVDAGHKSFELDAVSMSSGLYFIQMNTDGFSATRKLVLVH